MRNLVLGCAVAALVALSAQSEARPQASFERVIPPTPKPSYQVGVASWYGPECQGNQTANGEIFDMNGLTAAHRKLPLGTIIRVTNLKNNTSLVLRVNDRGPYIQGRVLDVSMAAARYLGFLGAGLTPVRIETFSPPAYALSGRPSSPFSLHVSLSDSGTPMRPNHEVQLN
jgi:rare lipoprotein A (peptidoglycan hydrolase)